MCYPLGNQSGLLPGFKDRGTHIIVFYPKMHLNSTDHVLRYNSVTTIHVAIQSCLIAISLRVTSTVMLYIVYLNLCVELLGYGGPLL